MSLKRKLVVCLAVVVLIGSVGMVAYPLVSDYLAGQALSEVVTAASVEVAATPSEDLTAAREAAEAYNRELATGVVGNCPSYDELLNLSGNGLMGILEIPRIDATLPIYHGTDGEVLAKGVGHLYGSSLPVGGESTHAVLSGHTGMAGQRMLTDLDQVQRGDTFCLRVLGETLTYEVDQIRVVLPEETEDLQIIPGEDHVTIVTCTPYGINSHRLLVRGVRVFPEETEADDKTDDNAPPVAAPSIRSAASTWRRQYGNSLLLGLGGAAVVVVAVLLVHRRKSKKRRKTPPKE